MSDSTRADMDGGWTQMIEDYVEEFFRFFFPHIHASINFDVKCEFMDKELAKIMVDAETGKRRVDKLIQVQWVDGSVEWILLHVEVQAQPDTNFAQRMYVYNHRIADRYAKSVISLALLVDGDRNFRPDRFCRERGGCHLEFRFPIVKLLDHKTEAELTADPSPFAIASLVQLRKLQAGSDEQRRYRSKVAFTRELYSRGYAKDDIIKLFRFIDYILRLPEDLAVRYRSDLESIEEELKMPYVTSVERLAKQEGIEQGIERGRQKGLEVGVLRGIRDSLFQTIQIRFDSVPKALRDSIDACGSVEQLSDLHRQALTANSLADLRSTLCDPPNDKRTQ